LQLIPRPADWDNTPNDPAVYAARTRSDPRTELLGEQFAQGRLHTDTGSDHGTRLTGLYRSARVSMEENGANTLYLALGMLVWYETPASTRPRRSPIVLVPAEIIRKSIQSGFILRAGDDEPQVNVTLIEMLRQDFDIDASAAALPADEHGIDVREVFTRLRRAISPMSRWDVVEDAFLGLFSFTKFVMWRDLKVRSEELKRNKTVDSLMSGSLTYKPQAAKTDEASLDQTVHPNQMYCPISADSSQLAAIRRAGAGESFVLHGPPGTGKSQTITNIIAHVLASGKTVLFVAEKMAALTVVQRRLKQIGLDPFCLELHSNKSRKKDVLDRLALALDVDAPTASEEWAVEADRLKTTRDALTGYVEAVHRLHHIGLSVFDAIGRLEALRGVLTPPRSAETPSGPSKPAVRFSPSDIAALDPERRREWADRVRQLRLTGSECGPIAGHPLTGIDTREYSAQLRPRGEAAVAALRQALNRLRSATLPVARQFSLEAPTPIAGRPAANRDLPPHEKEPGEALSRTQIEVLVEAAKLLLTTPTLAAALRANDWDIRQSQIRQWVAHGKARDALRRHVLSTYSPQALQLDITALQSTLREADESWFLPRWIKRTTIGKALAAVTKPGAAKPKDFAGDLDRLHRLLAEERILSGAILRAREVLGPLWQDSEADWDAVDAAARWAEQARKLSQRLADVDGGSHIDAAGYRDRIAGLVTERQEDLAEAGVLGLQFRTLVEANEAAIAAWMELVQALRVGHPESPAPFQGDGWSDAGSYGWFDQMEDRLSGYAEHLGELRTWCTWRSVRAQAIADGLGAVVRGYEAGTVEPDELEPAAEEGLLHVFVETAIAEDPLLRSFSRALFEDRVAGFRALDDHFTELTRREVRARVAARIPRAAELSGRATTGSEMGILQREIRKQRGHLALRELFQKIPNLLPRLKPCLLVSPMSAAQYLDPAQPPYDLVIFDEASQMPTCDAVGAIARGQECIVVGDPKQLGPTRFFSSQQSQDDESVEVPELESILDDCLALSMPQTHLQWHYRSRHESLIAFSNRQYYDNRLLTFPSADDLATAVHWRPVEGTYDRGGSKQNRAEAEAVTAEIVRRLGDPGLRQHSIGVVTFSRPQQQLIEDLLDEQLRANPSLEELAGGGDEPVFVKNLENVQGDERDVIIFSIGYGPDLNGRVSMNFGPLNQNGGSRRLNVAVSRARREMLVFTSLRAEHIDLSRTSAEGVKDLKAFLEYAERGKGTLASQSISLTAVDPEWEFSEQVARVLRARGHLVHTQVGCSGYRIDIAVADLAVPGRYLLGIECDGATYHHARTARDRDKLRHSVLTQLGWRLHRTWSTEWWHDRSQEIDRIEAAIAAARAALQKSGPPSPGQSDGRGGAPAAGAPDQRETRKASTTPTLFQERDWDEVPDSPPNTSGSQSKFAMYPQKSTEAEPYRVWSAPEAGPPDAFYSSNSDSMVLAQVREVVAVEGPISANLLARRVIGAWGMRRVASRIEARIRELCAGSGLRMTHHGDLEVYWPPSLDPESYTWYRTPGPDPEGRREIEDLPPEEIANAAREILASLISLPVDDLILPVARIFGFARTGADAADRIRFGIGLLEERGLARFQNGRVVYTG
ncbi:MAG: DUF3320 domain-containing protein, partial [Capsulimonadaceae bacterium]